MKSYINFVAGLLLGFVSYNFATNTPQGSQVKNVKFFQDFSGVYPEQVTVIDPHNKKHNLDMRGFKTELKLEKITTKNPKGKDMVQYLIDIDAQLRVSSTSSKTYRASSVKNLIDNVNQMIETTEKPHLIIQNIETKPGSKDYKLNVELARVNKVTVKIDPAFLKQYESGKVVFYDTKGKRIIANSSGELELIRPIKKDRKGKEVGPFNYIKDILLYYTSDTYTNLDEIEKDDKGFIKASNVKGLVDYVNGIIEKVLNPTLLVNKSGEGLSVTLKS